MATACKRYLVLLLLHEPLSLCSIYNNPERQKAALLSGALRCETAAFGLARET